MIKLYKKVDGNKVEVKSLKEVSTPFFICLDEDDNIVNLSIKSMEDNKNIDIIGIDYQYEEGKKASRNEAIVDNLILPFINNGEKVSQTKELNFITYGEGTRIYKIIEFILEERLKKSIYNSEELDNLLSKMFLISLSSKEDTSDLKAQTVSFVDVNDKNIETEFTYDYKNALQEQNTNRLFGHYGKDNNILCIHNGTGTGDLKEYLKDNGFISVLSYVLDKKNLKEDTKSDDILKVLNECEEDIIGSNYKVSYIKPKSDIDVAVDAANDIARLYHNEEKVRKQKEDLIDRLIANIKEYSSETTYNQILMASGMFEWKDPIILEAMSDKQVREYYDQIMSEVDEDMKNNTK